MKNRKIAISLLILAAGWLVGPPRSGRAQSRDASGGNQASNHIEYFAYWDDADNRSYDALPEVYDETNLAWIAEQAPGDLTTLTNYHISMLKQSQGYQMKASLSVEYVFYEAGAVLYSDWQTRWDQYASDIAPYMSNVVDIYPLDEPYESASSGGLPLATRRAQLLEITAAIRARFPGVKLACVCQPFSIEQNLDLTMFDWVGFDSYTDPFDTPGATTHDEWLTMLEKELDIPSSGRRTIVVPYACVINGQPANPSSSKDPTIADRIAQAADYYALAQNHPSVIAFVPFIYNSQSDLFGLDHMPPLHSVYQLYGVEITGR
ncbi:MAG TPA: hypothetical protein VI756_09370 [Blastocatellia bacterium]